MDAKMGTRPSVMKPVQFQARRGYGEQIPLSLADSERLERMDSSPDQVQNLSNFRRARFEVGPRFALTGLQLTQTLSQLAADTGPGGFNLDEAATGLMEAFDNNLGDPILDTETRQRLDLLVRIAVDLGLLLRLPGVQGRYRMTALGSKIAARNSEPAREGREPKVRTGIQRGLDSRRSDLEAPVPQPKAFYSAERAQSRRGRSVLSDDEVLAILHGTERKPTAKKPIEAPIRLGDEDDELPFDLADPSIMSQVLDEIDAAPVATSKPPLSPEEQAFADGVRALHHLEDELLGGMEPNEFDFGNITQIRVEQLRCMMNSHHPPNNGWDVLNAIRHLNKQSTWQKLPFTAKGQNLESLLKTAGLGMPAGALRKHLTDLEEHYLIRNTRFSNGHARTVGLKYGKETAADRWIVTSKGEEALGADNPKMPGVLSAEQLQQLIRYEASRLKAKQAQDEVEWLSLKANVDESKARLDKIKSFHTNMSDLLNQRLNREPDFLDTLEHKSVQNKMASVGLQIQHEEELHLSLKAKAEKALVIFEQACQDNQRKLQSLMAASLNIRQRAFNQELIAFTSDLTPQEQPNLGESQAQSAQDSLGSAILVLRDIIQSDLTLSEVRYDFSQEG